MDWLVTKAFKFEDGKVVIDNENPRIGFSNLSGGGSYVITDTLDSEAIQRAISNDYYDYSFCIIDELGHSLYEGLCEGFSDYSPLTWAVLNHRKAFEIVFSSVRHTENDAVVNRMTINDLEDEDE